jgi:hypothetical protein
MNLKKFKAAILAILGLSEFHEVEGKLSLTEEEKATLAKYGFTSKFVADFEAALNTPDEPKGNKGQTASAEVAVVAALLAQTTEQVTALTEELNRLKASASASAEQIAAKEAKIKELNDKVAALSALPEPDNGATAGRTGNGGAQAFNLDDERQLGGRQGVMFGLDRPYNMRAKAALLAREGRLLAVEDVDRNDFKTLTDDLGAFYRTPWRDRLQSFLVELPTIEKIFPLESGYQDLATLVNIWLGDFSQADNTVGSDFDKVAKGSYEFSHETLRMYGVMFAHRFKDLARLEKTWIGYLNREGSSPIKMSFIEFILTEVAKKLHNERELRRVNGVRKNPNPNVPGRFMEAADGLYEFIRKKIEGHIDYTPDGGTTGKTVYQIKPFNLPHITMANIGEVLYLGTSMIPAAIRDTGNVVCYLPSPLVTWYHKYNEAKYGLNQDYKPDLMVIKEYPNVKIVSVPNADNHHRVIWTIDGNIKCYEQKAGEMLNFQIEQQDWSLKVWSNWKESIWAEAVGYKYTRQEDMDGSRQLIWCNDYDRPSEFFVPGAPDANPSVLLHTSVETVANSAVYTITDIEDAKVGDVISLKCGADGEAGVKIVKKDKFALISADWTPSKGDVIKLMKRTDGNFIEIGRTTSADSAYQFAADAETPSLADATVFVAGENTKATAITNFTDAITGTIYTIHGAGDKFASTIANGGNFVLTEAMTLKAGSYIKLVKAEDGKFYEVARG